MSKFLALTSVRTGDTILINTRHINVIEVREGRTHVGINNTGASGFDVTESFGAVRNMIEEVPA